MLFPICLKPQYRTMFESVQMSASQSSTSHSSHFFKTKICPWYSKGKCERNSTCRFAHSDKEKRQLPDLSKTSLCPAFLKNKICSNDLCRFAHGIQELRATDDVYKTSLCYMFMKSKCRSGASCRHAHGTHELKHKSTNFKLRSSNPENSQVSSKPATSSSLVNILRNKKGQNKLVSHLNVDPSLNVMKEESRVEKLEKIRDSRSKQLKIQTDGRYCAVSRASIFSSACDERSIHARVSNSNKNLNFISELLKNESGSNFMSDVLMYNGSSLSHDTTKSGMNSKFSSYTEDQTSLSTLLANEFVMTESARTTQSQYNLCHLSHDKKITQSLLEKKTSSSDCSTAVLNNVAGSSVSYQNYYAEAEKLEMFYNSDDIDLIIDPPSNFLSEGRATGQLDIPSLANFFFEIPDFIDEGEPIDESFQHHADESFAIGDYFHLSSSTVETPPMLRNDLADNDFSSIQRHLWSADYQKTPHIGYSMMDAITAISTGVTTPSNEKTPKNYAAQGRSLRFNCSNDINVSITNELNFPYRTIPTDDHIQKVISRRSHF